MNLCDIFLVISTIGIVIAIVCAVIAIAKSVIKDIAARDYKSLASTFALIVWFVSFFGFMICSNMHAHPTPSVHASHD